MHTVNTRCGSVTQENIQDSADALKTAISELVGHYAYDTVVLGHLQDALRSVVLARAQANVAQLALNEFTAPSTAVAKYKEWQPTQLTPAPLPIDEELYARWFVAGRPVNE